jgi:hypothetical protein
MSRALEMATMALFGVFAFTPWAAGLMDLGCWFALSAQCTPIPWAADQGIRVFIALMWPVAAYAVTAVLAGVFCQ